MNKLLVIVPDRPSDFVKKGEIIERYYNPGNLFDIVHILLINDDKPDLAFVQKMVGNARVHLHNLPSTRKLFIRSFGWRPFLLHDWAKPAVELAKRIQPSLIRCHGNYLNAFVAYSIKKSLGIPYVVSLHTNPDENRRYWSNALMPQRISAYAIQSVEKISLKYADMVLPVYKSIEAYLKHLNVKNYEVCYNALNPSNISQKNDYSMSFPVKLLSVSRLIPEKNPENIIRSLALLPDASLTMIGDGSLRDLMMQLAQELGLSDRIEFIKAVENDQLCSMMKNYDIFVVHCEYGGIPKTVLEAFLVGLPVVINKRNGDPVPELTDNICMLVDNKPEGYGHAINSLILSFNSRKLLGETANSHAMTHWAPEKTEQKFVSIYKNILCLE